MKKIGLVGEDPNDTLAIKNLLNQKFSTNFIFSPILKNKRGYQLDNISTVRSLEVELENTSYDHIIFIRDLDGLPSDKIRYRKIESWYNNLNKVCNNKGLLLINIFELEALIFADIQTFNSLYKTVIKSDRNVMFIRNPKQELIRATVRMKKKFRENNCPELFCKLKYDAIIKNCSFFAEFTDKIQRIAYPSKVYKKK
jgi:hypothetical protein